MTIATDRNQAVIRVAIKDDNVSEGNEQLKVQITAVTNASLPSNSPIETTITILDDEVAPTISIANVSQDEGASTLTDNKMVFTVTTTPPSAREITATWTISKEADDEAIENEDYTGTTGTVRIAPYSPTGTFEIDIIGDAIPEPDESFTVTLSNVSEASLSTTDFQATGTIENDDGIGLSIATASLDEGDKNMTFTNAIYHFYHSDK